MSESELCWWLIGTVAAFCAILIVWTYFSCRKLWREGNEIRDRVMAMRRAGRVP